MRGRHRPTCRTWPPWFTVVLALSLAGAACSAPRPSASPAHPTVNGVAPATVKPRAPAPSRASPSAPPLIRSPFDHRFRAYVTSRGVRLAGAVYDRASGRTFLLRGSAAFDTASVVKLQIMGTLLAQAQASGQRLSTSVVDSMTRMIEVSDNDDATSLWNLAGAAPAIARFDQSLGMEATTPNAFGYWGDTVTTAADQVLLMRHLAYPNEALSTASRSLALALMEHVVPSQRWGVSTGVPPGVTVALKNGWLPVDGDDSIVNSVGWVRGDGRDYVVALLSDGNPTVEDGVETLDVASALIWKAMAQR